MFCWKHIFDGFDERLVLWSAPTQPVAPDLIRLQVHLGADQAVNPQRVHLPTMAQDLDRPLVIGAAQINNGSFGAALEIQFPAPGKHPSFWRLIVPFGAACLVGRHKPVAGRLEGRRAGMIKAVPDLLLPEMVETFIEILRPMFPRRGKNGRDAQGKTKANDLSEHVRMSVCALEARIMSNWA